MIKHFLPASRARLVQFWLAHMVLGPVAMKIKRVPHRLSQTFVKIYFNQSQCDIVGTHVFFQEKKSALKFFSFSILAYYIIFLLFHKTLSLAKMELGDCVCLCTQLY